MSENVKIRYEKKNQSLFHLIDKIKLWPSRAGIIHGVKDIENRGDSMIITTYCGETFVVWNSRHSRSARWLRNRWIKKPCPKCRVPEWKMEKYSNTVFKG
ncbi:MAG: pyrrolysine--tRNA(Pyl) ligase small subunit [Lachnospiraceae bacterium]|nr:pyrrolysine--tRNA(Pyl) ligase small subunit [Lachnospiraceae bacterium]